MEIKFARVKFSTEAGFENNLQFFNNLSWHAVGVKGQIGNTKDKQRKTSLFGNSATWISDDVLREH